MPKSQRRLPTITRHERDRDKAGKVSKKKELEQVFERVRRLVDDQPQKAAHVLSDWLNDERKTKRAKTSTRDKKRA